MKIFGREGLEKTLSMGLQIRCPVTKTNYPLFSSSFGTIPRTTAIRNQSSELTDDEVITLISNFQSNLLLQFVTKAKKFDFDTKWEVMSGYRNGGSDNSAHKGGVALDFWHPNLTAGKDQYEMFVKMRALLSQFVNLFRESSFPLDQILFGKGHVHLGWSRNSSLSFRHPSSTTLELRGISRNVVYGYEASSSYAGKYNLVDSSLGYAPTSWVFTVPATGLLTQSSILSLLARYDKAESSK